VNENILTELRRPFHPSAVEFKPQATTNDGSKAMAVPYADVRSYQNRLDEICGMNWSVTYSPWGDRIVCHLTINGVTRSSTGEGDAQSEKSEIAGTAAEAQAFKRACSCFGLGRYLYSLPQSWVELDPATKRFSAAGLAKLETMIVQHYRRATQTVNGATGEIIASVDGNQEPPLAKLNRVGLAFYGDGWEAKARQLANSLNSSAEQLSELTAAQLDRLAASIEKKIAEPVAGK
jgi:hypothetical protein